MPNTLVHLGVQGLGNRLISTEIDLKWVFLGCIIPDLPWIVRRTLIALAPGHPDEQAKLETRAVKIARNELLDAQSVLALEKRKHEEKAKQFRLAVTGLFERSLDS